MRRLTILFALGVVACGREASTEDTGASGDGGTGATNPACEGYEDAPPASLITVRFVNQTPIDIFLDAGCGQQSMHFVLVSSPDKLFERVTEGSCASTCERLQSESPNQCESPCVATSMRVPAGGTYEETWDGRGYVGREMPSECWFDEPGEQPFCAQIVSAPLGQYEVVVSAWDTCIDSEFNECECLEDGTCFGTVKGTQPTVTPVVFTKPSAGLVEYIFEPCAFGCAEPL